MVWAGEASTINLKLASVNPAAESVIMNFGTNVIAGSLTRFFILTIVFSCSVGPLLSLMQCSNVDDLFKLGKLQSISSTSDSKKNFLKLYKTYKSPYYSPAYFLFQRSVHSIWSLDPRLFCRENLDNFSRVQIP